MNAKKIMGAVLVALLAAALFVGAGAALEGDQGTYFVYQEDVGLTGTWTNGAASVIIDGGVILPVGDFVPGTYTQGKATMTVVAPTASYKLSAKYGNTPYLVANGGTVYNGSTVKLEIASLNDTVGFTKVLATIPPNGAKNVTFSTLDIAGDTYRVTETGTYKFQVIFNGSGLVAGTPANLLLDANVFSFKVVDADEATIAASIDTVYSGAYVTFTVTGTPGQVYAVNTTGFAKISTEQLLTFSNDDTNQTFTMPNTGKATFSAKVNTDKKEAVVKLMIQKDGTLKFINDAEVKIKVSAPVVTATLKAPAYFIGDEIELTGTSTAEATFTFNMTGTNVAEFRVQADEFDAGKEWTANLTVGKKLDVGTYTIKVYQGDKVVATLPVALKQPFISIAEAPEVVGQGDAATFLITAEAASNVQAYFFGTNYFTFVPTAAQELDEEDEVIPGLFNVTLTETDTNKSKMATGQYFAVFQHPMYDKFFNIYADNGMIVLNATGVENDEVDLFNATTRQTANAAQALCDELEGQNIDDMYVKYSFFVVEDLKKDTFSMSEIPTEVVKGDKIVISGVDTASKEGTLVTVEMVSTAFAAVPKETVGSAAFILVTTTIAEDGTWEVTLDTSDLNVDEYSLSVAINAVPKESVTVNVVEGSEPVTPTDEPTVVPTDEPVTPTEAPATPGFGALAALAGLGAVAVLLLRRE